MTWFLFPGLGRQTPGVGRDFYEQSSVVRETLDEAATLGPPGLLDRLFHGTPEDVAQTEIAQIGIMSLQIGIARHLQAKGITCTGCTGHSLGEVCALVIAGVVDFAAAAHFTHLRSRLTHELAPEGRMAAVLGVPPEHIEPLLPEDCEISNYNGPLQTVISGTTEGIEQARAALKAAGAKRVIILNVRHPFHSKHMQAPADAFRDAIRNHPMVAPRMRFISSVNGTEVSDPEEIRHLIWRQFTSPVRWTDVMQRLGSVPAIEVGPGGILASMARHIPGAPCVRSADSLEEANALTLSE